MPALVLFPVLDSIPWQIGVPPPEVFFLGGGGVERKDMLGEIQCCPGMVSHAVQGTVRSARRCLLVVMTYILTWKHRVYLFFLVKICFSCVMCVLFKKCVPCV